MSTGCGMSSSTSNPSITGIPAVLAGKPRQKLHSRSKNFHHRYLALCRSCNFKPIPEIASPKRKGNSAYALLDVYCDRFTGNDWQLIVKALPEDRSLQWMALRLRKACPEAVDVLVQPADGKQSKNRPTICEKRLLKPLIESVGSLLATNQKLETFTLEGFPLAGVWANSLALGLKNSTSLTELNLARCAIGDEGCEAICRELKFRPNVLTLNLSACQLTERACVALADTIRFQKIQRYETSWEMSLRYGDVKEDKLFGVRCLYLSHNPALGDGGMQELVEVLKDDAWVRQVHLRNCGLTDVGAQMLLECLNLNATIEQFDIRDNLDISGQACQEILMKLGAQDLDIGDALDSGTKSQKKNGATLASLREQLEQNKAQLESALERNIQLESTVAQLNLRLGDYAMQISDLQRQLTISDVERTSAELREMSLEMANDEPKPSHMQAAVKLRKTQSEYLTTTRRSKGPVASASEMVVIPRSTVRAHGPKSGDNRVIERTIGDSCLVEEELPEPDTTHSQMKPLEAKRNSGVPGDGWQPGEIFED